MSLTGLLQSRSGSPWRIHLACVLLAILAVCWRLPFAATMPVTTVDEVRFAQPTVERIMQGDWVLYVSGTNYGAPVQEALSALLSQLSGQSALTLRLPVLLLGALAIIVAFWSVREAAGAAVAFGIVALLAFGNSAVCRYTTFAHPCYATLFVLVGLIQLATFWTDRSRTLVRWTVLALLMGVSLYVLKLSLIQSAVSLAWLWYRSGHAQRCASALRSALRSRVQWGIGAIATTGIVALPVVYRFLTRRAVYEMSSAELYLLGVSAVALLAGVFLLAPVFALPQRREWVAAGLCIACLTIIPIPATVWYTRIERPRLAEQHQEPYTEIAYSWKHLHDWPKQARILMEGVLPAILLGRYDRMEHNPEAAWPLGWKTATMFVAVAALGTGAGRRSRFSSSWLRPIEKDWVLILPFFATLLVLLPSWSLFGDSSYRYLLAFLPGLYLFAFRCLEYPIRRYRHPALLILAGYFVYCGIDCVFHVTP